MSKGTIQEFIDSLPTHEQKEFEQGYKELVLSELILALMEEDEISIRKLAKEADLSPKVVQAMRSGAKKDFTLKSFLKILKGLGCKLTVETKLGTVLPMRLNQKN